MFREAVYEHAVSRNRRKTLTKRNNGIILPDSHYDTASWLVGLPDCGREGAGSRPFRIPPAEGLGDCLNATAQKHLNSDCGYRRAETHPVVSGPYAKLAVQVRNRMASCADFTQTFDRFYQRQGSNWVEMARCQGHEGGFAEEHTHHAH